MGTQKTSNMNRGSKEKSVGVWRDLEGWREMFWRTEVLCVLPLKARLVLLLCINQRISEAEEKHKTEE